eukprot:scaffold5688_cov116-Isochrysis_galbana.AAC.7
MEETKPLKLERGPVFRAIGRHRSLGKSLLHEGSVHCARVWVQQLDPRRGTTRCRGLLHQLLLLIARCIGRPYGPCQRGRLALRVLGREQDRVDAHGRLDGIGRGDPVQVALGLVALRRGVGVGDERQHAPRRVAHDLGALDRATGAEEADLYATHQPTLSAKAMAKAWRSGCPASGGAGERERKPGRWAWRLRSAGCGCPTSLPGASP